MREVELNKKKVKIYDSIEELPIERFHKYNKYYLIDTCLGSDISDIDMHIQRAIQFIGSQKEKAVTELENLRRGLHLINETINSKHLAYGVLIAEIDGVRMDDLSDEGIRRTLEKINDVPKGVLDRLMELVKKKIDTELSTYFPAQFDDARQKEALEQVRKRTLLVLDGIMSGVESDDIKMIDDYLLTFINPRPFYGSNNAEVLYDKQFNEMNILLQNEIHTDYKKTSVLEYYSAFDYLKKLRKK